MADLLDKEEVCASSPKNERSMTMVIILPSSIERCGGSHGLCHHFLEESGSALLVLGRRE